MVRVPGPGRIDYRLADGAVNPYLLDAIRAFEDSSTMQAVLGKAFCDGYGKLKRQEWDSYMGRLTQWERDTTLDC